MPTNPIGYALRNRRAGASLPERFTLARALGVMRERVVARARLDRTYEN